MGTGTGILGILLCGKTKLRKVTGIEVQAEIAEMAERSIKLNNLQDRFNIVNENIKNIPEMLSLKENIVKNGNFKVEKKF